MGMFYLNGERHNAGNHSQFHVAEATHYATRSVAFKKTAAQYHWGNKGLMYICAPYEDLARLVKWFQENRVCA